MAAMFTLSAARLARATTTPTTLMMMMMTIIMMIVRDLQSDSGPDHFDDYCRMERERERERSNVGEHALGRLKFAQLVCIPSAEFARL